MTPFLKVGAVGVSAVVSIAALVLSCSSTVDSPPSAATTLDEAGVTRGIQEMGALLPVCKSAFASVAPRITAPPAGPTAKLPRLLALRYDPALRAAYGYVNTALGARSRPTCLAIAAAASRTRSTATPTA